VKKTIADWVEKGGRVIVDETTKIKFPKAIVTKADLRDPQFRWSVLFSKAERKDHPFKNDREASYYLTNHFMDEMARKAAPHFKTALKKTKAQPTIETDSVHLAAERHTAGEAALHMVINAHDKLPDIGPKERYPLYNYAPLEATFTLKGIKPGSVVFCTEGQDWKKGRQVKDYDKPQKASFEPGEMKLYLVSPKPIVLKASAARLPLLPGFAGVALAPTVAPCPVFIRVVGPDGKEVYRMHRATDVKKPLTFFFPLAANAPAGKYRCEISSPFADQPPDVVIAHSQAKPDLVTLDRPVRTFDSETIAEFLKGKPDVVVAYGDAGHKEMAAKLARDLTALGIKATARPDSEVLRKVSYPRVWNPFAMVYSATGAEKAPKDVKVATRITLGIDKGGKLTAKTDDDKDVSQDWKQPNSLVTIAGEGYVDFGGDRELCYEAGVKLYFDKDRKLTVVKGEAKETRTTAEFRKRWAKPWDRLTTHVGAYQLPAQLPEAYTTAAHLVLLGDSTTSKAMAVLQGSELLPQCADAKYPGPGRALVQFAWSPFAVEKNVIAIGASDRAGLESGIKELLRLAGKK
jgi:hypothetical protein